MELKKKLRELRTGSNMTQEEVADSLGVSSQTVSKWERGLLSPDIYLLPRIALLFKCSIDSLFDMELAWSTEHRREFEKKIHDLGAKRDWDGVYQAWISEIELDPENYSNYPIVMLHVFRKKLYKKIYVEKMLSLAEHAEKYCPNDDIRNEIYRIMLQLCSESDDKDIKEKGKYYYQKLPQLCHSREVYAKFVMDTCEYRDQILKNIICITDIAECSIRQLILPDMPLEEKLFYYKKAAALYETVLDSKYAGSYDLPLLSDYYEIAVIYVKLDKEETAYEYVSRIFEILEKHIISSHKENKSALLYDTVNTDSISTEVNCLKLLQSMANSPELQSFKGEIINLQQRFTEYFSQNLS